MHYLTLGAMSYSGDFLFLCEHYHCTDTQHSSAGQHRQGDCPDGAARYAAVVEVLGPDGWGWACTSFCADGQQGPLGWDVNFSAGKAQAKPARPDAAAWARRVQRPGEVAGLGDNLALCTRMTG